MAEIKFTITDENFLGESCPPSILNNEIYYNCSECSSSIEIISINEQNNVIEFNCLSKENKHPKKISIPLKEYFEKMKKFNRRELNNDECEIHKDKYISFCFDCNCHLCKKCLKSRVHLNHMKNNIIEIEPTKEELNIINEVIKDYENKIENITKEKQIKVKKMKKLLNKNINNEKNKIEKRIKKHDNDQKNELKLNHAEFI